MRKEFAILLGLVAVLAVIFAFQQEGPDLYQEIAPKVLQVIKSALSAG